jgi:hypothetical protein
MELKKDSRYKYASSNKLLQKLTADISAYAMGKLTRGKCLVLSEALLIQIYILTNVEEILFSFIYTWPTSQSMNKKSISFPNFINRHVKKYRPAENWLISPNE